MNRAPVCAGDSESFVNDGVDSTTGNVIARDYRDTPIAHPTEVFGRIGKVRNRNLHHSGGVDPEIFDEAADGRAVAHAIANIKVRVDGDEPSGGDLFAPRGSSHGDRQRVVTTDRHQQPCAGNRLGNHPNCARLVTIGVDHVTEVVAHQSCPSVNRIARLKRFGISRKNIANRGGCQVCRTWGD